MIKQIYISTRPCHSGVTLTEYAILIALIGILGVAGLNALGGKTSGLLQGSTKNMEANNTLSLLAPAKQAQSVAIEPSGQGQSLTQKYYKMVTEEETGAPELQISNTAAGTGTNVSSADGLQESSIALANAAQLAEMANKETDPATQSYYRKLAELTYWLGGTQGILDNVKPLIDFANSKIGLRTYTKKNALNDMLKYQSKLQAMIQNPPAEIAGEDVDVVRPLVQNALGISQSYMGKYKKVLVQRADGTYFINPAATPNLEIRPSYIAVNGKMNEAQLKRAQKKYDTRYELFKGERRVTTRSYGTFVKLPEMEKVAKRVANNKSVTSNAVKTTLKTGTALVEKAATSTSTTSQPVTTAPKSTTTAPKSTSTTKKT